MKTNVPMNERSGLTNKNTFKSAKKNILRVNCTTASQADQPLEFKLRTIKYSL